MPDEPRNQPESGLGYPEFQLARAFTTAEFHDDTATRERAQERIARWRAVWSGMVSGALKIGSRAPVADVPAWATLEVVTGGFATGTLLAGGLLSSDERSRLAALGADTESANRYPLNAYYLTDAGQKELTDLLETGLFHIEVPEHGALLCVAWLLRHGHSDRARELIDAIGPLFSKLAFYPVASPHPQRSGPEVCLQDVASTIEQIRKVEPNPKILAQKEAVEVWRPLYDKIIAHFLETVEGPPPTLMPGSSDADESAHCARTIVGGWPCRRFPDDWTKRGFSVLVEYEAKRAAHYRCTKPDRRKDSFAQVRVLLELCIKDPRLLTGRDVGRLRLILARYVSKHGLPGSTSHREKREFQAKQTEAPTFHSIAQVLIHRLEQLPRGGGIEHFEVVTSPVTHEEMRESRVVVGTQIPGHLLHKARRALLESIDSLVEQDVITSSETLARVLPQITAHVRATGFADPALRQLYSGIYQAFRRRRSLLLLDLQSQVQPHELPWMAAIQRFRDDSLSAQEVARQTLEEVVALAITSFPHAIIPNKLLQELRTLASGAALDIPLVEEVAADIFMGEFTGKFVQAARRTAESVDGTLYQRYYAIDCREIRALPETGSPKKRSWFKRTPDSFAELCSRRAGVALGGWNPAINGMVIEQQQILTTQNLSVLFEALNLRTRLAPVLGDLARRCFLWICSRQQMKITDWHARLVMVKNTAYAWRQLVYFLSLCPDQNQRDFVREAREELVARTPESQARLEPVLCGLEVAVDGRTLDDAAKEGTSARCFLGWSKEKHWMLG